MNDEKFDTVEEALESLKQGNTSETVLRAQFGELPGIERSITIALAKRANTKSREDVSAVVTNGISLE